MDLFQYASRKTKKYVFREFNRVQVPTFRQGGETTDFCVAKLETASTPVPPVSGPDVTEVAAPATVMSHSDINELKKQLDGKFEYEVTNSSVTITKHIGSAPNVEIPHGVTSIGEKAFRLCEILASVTIPNSVTSIGKNAFNDCDFTSVTLPDSVTSIGGGSFACCSELTEIRVSAGNTCFKSEDGILFSADGKTLIQVPAGKGLTQYTIPDGVTSIGEWAFAECESLTSVTIPDSVTIIGDLAFSSCDNLTSVTIPDSVTSIGWGVFSSCYDLTIYGKSGSEAERYAEKEGIKFQVR